jgi:hypothetical protein
MLAFLSLLWSLFGAASFGVPHAGFGLSAPIHHAVPGHHLAPMDTQSGGIVH